jgi:hypothetical protein
MNSLCMEVINSETNMVLHKGIKCHEFIVYGSYKQLENIPESSLNSTLIITTFTSSIMHNLVV